MLDADHDALGLAALVRAGEVTAAELLDTAVARIEALDPLLNAVVHRFEDMGRAAIAAGLPDGPFAGVPFLIKNTGLAMAGTPLSTGSRLFADAVTPTDGTLAARQKAAGLVAIGRTNTPEFALSFATESELFGPARNPWDTTRGPGGSSGGSAAAVAARIVPIAHASDGAGSTRLPAAHCGVFGFKPSRIRNPLGPDIAEGIAGMSTPHAITVSVRDSAALLDATSGPDVGDPHAVPPPVRPFLEETRRDPPRLRIGLVTASPYGAVDPECVAAAEDAARLCAELGHTVEIAGIDYEPEALKAAWRVIAGVGIVGQIDGRARVLGIDDPAALIEPVNAAWLAEGRGWTGTDYLKAVNQLHRTARHLGRFFARYDVLLSPATGEIAPVLGRMASSGQSLDAFYDQFWAHGPFTCAFNASGCPAMSVPLHWTAPTATAPRGLPVGVQFGAGFGNDGLLFALAAELERARPWSRRRPALAEQELAA